VSPLEIRCDPKPLITKRQEACAHANDYKDNSPMTQNSWRLGENPRQPHWADAAAAAADHEAIDARRYRPGFDACLESVARFSRSLEEPPLPGSG